MKALCSSIGSQYDGVTMAGDMRRLLFEYRLAVISAENIVVGFSSKEKLCDVGDIVDLQVTVNGRGAWKNGETS